MQQQLPAQKVGNIETISKKKPGDAGLFLFCALAEIKTC
jgi:hypothetical protein